MQRRAKPFLTAQWLNLAVVNFAIEPRVLAPYLPAGLELDRWRGQTYASLVGFQFRDIRVCGIGVPFHRQFDEVNLRFYVRRMTPTGWRRGVVFVREVAPRRAVAWSARWFYGENYVTAPVQHRMSCDCDVESRRAIEYTWQYSGHDYRLRAEASDQPAPAHAGSEAEFFLEQYWGYSSRAGRRAIEYRVEHPPWNVSTCTSASFTGDVAAMYGPDFEEALSSTPLSAYLADGSTVSVFRGVDLPRTIREQTRADRRRRIATTTPNLSARQKIG